MAAHLCEVNEWQQALRYCSSEQAPANSCCRFHYLRAALVMQMAMLGRKLLRGRAVKSFRGSFSTGCSATKRALIMDIFHSKVGAYVPLSVRSIIYMVFTGASSSMNERVLSSDSDRTSSVYVEEVGGVALVNGYFEHL
jgi:hypothetical protein